MEKAEVTFRPGRAVVRYDPARVTVEQMIEAVRKAGFSARPLEGGRGSGRLSVRAEGEA